MRPVDRWGAQDGDHFVQRELDRVAVWTKGDAAPRSGRTASVARRSADSPRAGRPMVQVPLLSCPVQQLEAGQG